MEVSIDQIIHAQETALTIKASRRRTTVPLPILEYYKLKDGDTIRWILLEDGTVLVRPGKKKKK